MKAGPFAMVDWFGTPQSPALHVIERYRLLDTKRERWLGSGGKRDARAQAAPSISTTGQAPAAYISCRG